PKSLQQKFHSMPSPWTKVCCIDDNIVTGPYGIISQIPFSASYKILSLWNKILTKHIAYIISINANTLCGFFHSPSLGPGAFTSTWKSLCQNKRSHATTSCASDCSVSRSNSPASSCFVSYSRNRNALSLYTSSSACSSILTQIPS